MGSGTSFAAPRITCRHANFTTGARGSFTAGDPYDGKGIKVGQCRKV